VFDQVFRRVELLGQLHDAGVDASVGRDDSWAVRAIKHPARRAMHPAESTPRVVGVRARAHDLHALDVDDPICAASCPIQSVEDVEVEQAVGAEQMELSSEALWEEEVGLSCLVPDQQLCHLAEAKQAQIGLAVQKSLRVCTPDVELG